MAMNFQYLTELSSVRCQEFKSKKPENMIIRIICLCTYSWYLALVFTTKVNLGKV